MVRKDEIERIIYLTMREINDRGLDLIDEFNFGDDQKAINIVYKSIKDEI